MKRESRPLWLDRLPALLATLFLLAWSSGCGGSVNVPIEQEFIRDSETPGETASPSDTTVGEDSSFDVTTEDSAALDSAALDSAALDSGATDSPETDSASPDTLPSADTASADTVIADADDATATVDTGNDATDSAIDSFVAADAPDATDSAAVDVIVPDTALDTTVADTFDAGADTAPGVITISIADVTVAEGNTGVTAAMFTVSLSAPATKIVTVQWATADGTATAFGAAFSGGKDYSASSGLVTFAIGETTKTISVPILGDAVDEDDEDFTVSLSSPINAVIADASALGTITNDDVLPGITIEDSSATEGLSGQKSITFNVTLSTASGRAVSVAYATSDGTATAGSDYVATSGSVVFEAGQTKKTIQVQLFGDGVLEPDETFFVTLTSPKNVTLTRGVATGKIVNDD